MRQGIALDGRRPRLSFSTHSQAMSNPVLVIAAACCIAAIAVPRPATSRDRVALEENAPPLADVPARIDPIFALKERRQLPAQVRASSYRGRVRLHPLVAKAAYLLATELTDSADGVFVTSLVRSPEDQHRLRRQRRTRHWAVQRSKHMMGLAADIAFVERHVSISRLRDHAEALLQIALGEQARRLRVVKESHCIHIEIKTHDPDVRTTVSRLYKEGVLRRVSRRHPVPAYRQYEKERVFNRRPRRPLAELAL